MGKSKVIAKGNIGMPLLKISCSYDEIFYFAPYHRKLVLTDSFLK